MRIAVISDVHANADALAAVLRAIEGERVASIVSLGDVVGYNAFPRETIALLRQARVTGVAGNHDLMVLGEIPATTCGPRGRRAVEWTAEQLTADEFDYLRGLPREISDSGALFVHSMLGSTVTRLSDGAQFSDERDAIAARFPQVRVCFTGHTHRQHAGKLDPAGQLHPVSKSHVWIGPNDFWFVNPGTVGEPRGKDQRAAFAVYDSTRRTVEFRRVPYDRTRVLQENQRQGLVVTREPELVSITSRMRRLVRRAASLVTSRIA